jgi:hypothetical protein
MIYINYFFDKLCLSAFNIDLIGKDGIYTDINIVINGMHGAALMALLTHFFAQFCTILHFSAQFCTILHSYV